MENLNIIHEPEKQRFILTLQGETAHVAYRIENGAFDIRHTVVPPPLEGRGIASALVREAYDYARENGYKILATCSYAVRWLQRHPEYEGTPSDEYCAGNACAL